MKRFNLKSNFIFKWLIAILIGGLIGFGFGKTAFGKTPENEINKCFNHTDIVHLIWEWEREKELTILRQCVQFALKNGDGKNAIDFIREIRKILEDAPE